MSIFDLFLNNVMLALQAFGGAMATLPAIEALGWVPPDKLAQLAAIGQASPGPNMLLLPLVGWHVAGIAGAVVAAVGFCLPSASLVLALYSRWSSLKDSSWKQTLQFALAPIGAAAVLISTLSFFRLTGAAPRSALAVLAIAWLSQAFRIPPVVLIALGGLLGAATSFLPDLLF